MTGLYRTPRTYFDHICSEYQSYPMESKLLDIGYATWHGHDIMDDIREILENHPHVSENDLRFGVYDMLAELNGGDPYDYYATRSHNSLETEVRALVEDLMKVYRFPFGYNVKPYLANDASRIYFSELCAMNGWHEALLEERQPYQMYSYGHWIMFPGDGEIIREFNLRNCAEGKAYVSYVYPEPWYGCPTRAKIIVLGSEVRYDGFVSRSQNLMLSKLPRGITEAVQIMVDRWLELESGSFYAEDYIPPDDDMLRYSDLYCSPTYRFWLRKIWDFIECVDLQSQEVYDNIAVINANPYTALNVGPLEPGLLPSHYFLRQMVRYIVNHSRDVVFLLPSERLGAVWQTILADVFDTIASQGRLFITGSNSLSLTANLDQNDILHLKSFYQM